MREKCSYSEFFRSVFSRIWTEYGERRSGSFHAVASLDLRYQNTIFCHKYTLPLARFKAMFHFYTRGFPKFSGGTEMEHCFEKGYYYVAIILQRLYFLHLLFWKIECNKASQLPGCTTAFEILESCKIKQALLSWLLYIKSSNRFRNI